MKAITQDSYGSADVLHLNEVPEPVLDAKEVIVKVDAAGVDASVLHMITGRPLAMRAAGFGMRAPKNPIPGAAFAGKIVEIGSDVTGYEVGQAVYGVAKGAFAEFARARVDRIAAVPRKISAQQAASVPISATAALIAVRDSGRIKAGQKVLVLGASGSVGSFAVQIAQALGGEVTGVCSKSKLEFVRSLGVKEAVDYQSDDLSRLSGQFDLVIDTGGARNLRTLRRLLTRKGTLVIVGAEGVGGPLLGGSDRAMLAGLFSLFISQRMAGFISVDRTEHLEFLRQLIDEGKISVIVDRVFPLAQAAEAVQYVQDGRARGRVVISI